MADLTLLIPAGRQVIESYGGGRFRVTGQVYEGSVIVRPTATIPWPVRSMADLSLPSFSAILQAETPVEILLLGCGPRLAMVPSSLRQGLRASGIVVDAMDTGAACRTYNVLLAEERRVAAALIAVE